MFVRRSTYDRLLAEHHKIDIKVARLEEFIRLSEKREEELKEQIAKAEKAAERHEKRADNAVDSLLAKGGNAPIQPPDMSQADYMKMVMGEADNIHEEDEDEVRKIVRRMEEGDEAVFDLAGDDR